MIKYREIQAEDNERVKNIIRTSLTEFDGNRPGTAYYDDDVLNMYEAYLPERSVYFVAEVDGKVVGGGGIQPLKDTDQNICELQKVYIDKEYRGKGIGKKIVQMCIDFAKKSNYDAIYLETFPNMIGAQKLYKKLGFRFIDHALGNTGHKTNEIWMLKKLK
jgi:putative acetyltransferase